MIQPRKQINNIYGYVRVSSEQQVKDGSSLDEQKRIIEEFVQAKFNMKCEMSTPTNRMPQIRQSFAQAEHALLTRAVSNLGHGGGHGHGHGGGLEGAISSLAM